jgi:LysR family transcriptional regulator, regulator of abg operon
MKLSHLRDVLAVADAGSLRAASRQLGVAQPVMTRNIRDIENELGVALFERHARGMRLTEMGDVFVRRASTIDAEMRRIHEEIEQLKGRATGQITIVASSAASIAVLPRALNNFRKEYPKALIKVSENLFQPAEADLLEGRVDVYIGAFDESAFTNKFVIEKLFDNQRVIVARKGHPLSDAKTLNTLVGAQWIRPTLASHMSEADFDQMFACAGLPAPEIVIHSRSTLITLLLVANSDMLTILPKQWFEFVLAPDLFQPLQVDDPLVAAPVCMVTRRDVPPTPMLERLCDFVRRAGLNYVSKELNKR